LGPVWSVSTKHTTEFVIEALLDALKTVGKPILVHTDQGSECNSKEYLSMMEYLGIKVSMNANAALPL